MNHGSMPWLCQSDAKTDAKAKAEAAKAERVAKAKADVQKAQGQTRAAVKEARNAQAALENALQVNKALTKQLDAQQLDELASCPGAD